MSAKRILQLNLKRKFFDDIALGKKDEEYRERKEYWATRLEGRDYDSIVFRNGYSPRAPMMEVEFKGFRKTTRNDYPIYAIGLGRVLRVKRWRGPIEE